MLAQAADTAISADPWRFQWHPEVWVLVGFLTAAFVYMIKVIGPNAVPAGQPAVSRKNTYAFVGAMALLWVASDWPLHDISEEYLYSAMEDYRIDIIIDQGPNARSVQLTIPRFTLVGATTRSG